MEYVITFLEGVISFISPCTLPLLPVYIAYLAGGQEMQLRAAGEAAAQPGDANVTPAKPQQAPKAPFSAEDAVKYKEGIKLVKEYSEELNKCVEAKMSGKAIDDAAKQRIAELQNKLGELEKAGKMNQQLLDLKKVNDDVYNKVIAK